MKARKGHQPPAIGSKFTKRFKDKEYTMTVVQTETGSGYKVDRTVYRSPSAAAKSITETEVNGWYFWKIGNYEDIRKRP